MFFVLFYFLFTYFLNRFFFLCNPELMMILLSQHHEFWNKRHSLLFIHSLILPSTFSLMRSYFVAQDGFSSQSSYLHLLSVVITCLCPHAWPLPTSSRYKDPALRLRIGMEGASHFYFGLNGLEKLVGL